MRVERQTSHARDAEQALAAQTAQSKTFQQNQEQTRSD